ncbi:hypothetical protein [Verminephrobacter aporrectodeae]|uniref:hypothetical protein n=1 Tax=Verminephrobacter aporrectodeae TaxID=1110389 RepID=UPI00223824F8|nr:hypothetical protein [Verminephrobacter aporrectodeae]
MTNINKYVANCVGATTAFVLGSVSTAVAGLSLWFFWTTSPHAAPVGMNQWICHYHGEEYSTGSVLGMDAGDARECRLVNGMLVWVSSEKPKQE